MKKENQTPEEITLMYQVRKEWIDRCDSGAEINKEEATKWINWLYTSSKLKKPQIIYLSSPLGCQYAMNLSRDNVGVNVGVNVRDNVWDNVWDNVEVNVRDNVEVNVRANVRANVRDNVWDNVEVNVGVNVGVNVRDNVWANVRDNELKFECFASYGSISDYGWVAFYDYFARIGILKHDGFNKFHEGLKSNVYDMIQMDNVCYVAELPEFIKRDEKGRMHSVNGPAIHWRDGYELYYIHGINFTFQEFQDFVSGKTTAKDIMQNSNQDKKRVLSMAYGNEKLITDLEAKICGEEIDDSGHPMRLYSIKMGEDETLVIYQGVCPSKGEVVYLRVPPEFEKESPYKAKCWTYPELWEAAQKTEEKLKFIIET